MKETEAHKRAFNYWYDLGVTRSYPQVTRKLSVSLTSVKKWAKCFKWQEKKVLKDDKEKNHELNRILADQKVKQEKEKDTKDDPTSIKDSYRKDIDNALKSIKATILSSVDPKTKKLKINVEGPGDINALATAYEKLAKLDLLLSDEPPVTKNAIIQTLNGIARNHPKDKPRGPGRKSKLTPELQERLLKAVRSNMTIERASLLCGITPETYYNWCKSGDIERKRIIQGVQSIKTKDLIDLDADETEAIIANKITELNPNKYFGFFIEVKRAEAESESRNLQSIERARDGGEYVSEVHLEKNAKGKIVKRREIKKYLQPQWQAAAWILERKFPALYGRRTTYDGKLDATVRNDRSFETDIKDITGQKDEMQSKRRVTELALSIMKLATKSKMIVAPGAKKEPVIDVG